MGTDAGFSTTECDRVGLPAAPELDCRIDARLTIDEDIFWGVPSQTAGEEVRPRDTCDGNFARRLFLGFLTIFPRAVFIVGYGP